MDKAREIIGTPYKIAVSVIFDVVHIELICGDQYVAQVLLDDLVDRLKSGEGITLSLEQKPAKALQERET